MVVHPLKSTRESKWISVSFKTSLVYIASFRLARVILQDLVSKNQFIKIHF